MLTRYWDDDLACWAYGESIFDGRELPMPDTDRRFWRQREAALGQGSLGLGEYPTQHDMRQADSGMPR